MKLYFPKSKYYLLYLYYKLRVIGDCKKGKLYLILAEFLHLSNGLFHTTFEIPGSDNIREIETIFGKFRFLADLYGYFIMSPAFERPDIEEFTNRISKSLAMQKRVLFIDIGANVGLYTIGVSKHVPQKRLTVIAFEPDPLYYSLLVHNVRANNIKHVTLYNNALGGSNKIMHLPGYTGKNGKAIAGKIEFRMKKLDSIISRKYYHDFDEIYVKMDIEGFEQEALEGAMRLRGSKAKITVLIEDCIRPSITKYLVKQGFAFDNKITPYNSFWTLHDEPVN